MIPPVPNWIVLIALIAFLFGIGVTTLILIRKGDQRP